MKKLIAKLLVGIFSLGLCVNLSAEEWKSYKFTDPEKRHIPHPDVIKLEKNDKVDFVNMITSHKNHSYLEHEIHLDDDIMSQMAYYATSDLKTNGDHQIVQNFVTLYGPCTLKLFGSIWKNRKIPDF